jgi:hypothetical protein
LRARVCAREAGGAYEKRQVEERGNGIGADSEREERGRRVRGGEEGPSYVVLISPSRFFGWKKIAEMGEDNVNDVFAL